MNRDELRTIWKRRLNLNIWKHLGYTLHDFVAREHFSPLGHKFGYGFSIAGAFQNRRRYQSSCLRKIELKPSGLSALRKKGGGEYQQLIFLSGGQVHAYTQL
jgi:hypothetical protein